MSNMENLEEIKRDKTIKADRLRFTKNNIPALLIYLAIVLDVLFFILIYKTNNEFFYKPLIGVSIITNLIFLLASFLCSEGIKNYKKTFSYVMVALGIVQIVRVFVYPTQAYEKNVIADAKFVRCLIYLIGSAACLIGGAVIGYIRTDRLENHIKSLNIQTGK